MTQVTTLMVTLLNESKYVSKQATDLLSRHLVDTMNTVKTHDEDIVVIKNEVKNATNCYSHVATNQTDILKRLLTVEALLDKSKLAAAESRQRSVKGNFILSGDLIPNFSQDENLY